jgi:hypothetical protein
MPIRMLSVDTPEVTARSPERAAAIDQEFAQLAEWIGHGRAPVSKPLAEFLLPKLSTGQAGSLQFGQGQQASAFAKQNTATRLARPNGSVRNLFIRAVDQPFDENGRRSCFGSPGGSSTATMWLGRLGLRGGSATAPTCAPVPCTALRITSASRRSIGCGCGPTMLARRSAASTSSPQPAW